MILASSAALAESVLNVSGHGTVMVEADTVTVCLGVSLMGRDLTELQQQANSAIENVCAALKAQGVDEKDISTNYLYIYPQYDYSSDIASVTGYSINNSMTIVTKSIDTVGELIDAAFAAGANNFDSISFSVQDDTEARNQALELAVQNAFEKAEVIANASGKAIESILSIDETGSAYDYNSSSGVAKGYSTEAAYDAGTTVRAAQIAVSASVKMTFEIK